MPFLMQGQILYLDEPPLEIVMNEEVLQHFLRYKQDAFWKCEAGGQLFASIAGSRWEIIKATGPRKSDYRKRFRFFPNRKDEQTEINSAFDDGLHYVGDWHTHPERQPTPSDLDLTSMADLVRCSEHQLPGFLMVIAGTENAPDGLWISFHTRNGLSQPLRLRS